MLDANVRLFKLWGIPVEINMSWTLVLVFMTWTFATNYYPLYFPGVFGAPELWILGFVTALFLFISILMHEFSHSLVAARNGMPIRKITLFMFGGVAQMERDVDSPIQELKTAAAGPAMTVGLAVLFFVLSGLFRANTMGYALLRSLMRINIVVLVFNLVPGFPLDGGRILRSVLWHRTGDFVGATRIASRVGRGFAILLIVIGVIYIFIGNFVGGLWMIFIGFFLYQAARSGYMAVALKERLGQLRVDGIMRTGVVSVETSTSLRTLIDEYFLRYHYDAYPVLRSGELVGIVSLKDVKRIERERWTDVTVEQIMNRDVVRYALHPLDRADKLINLIMRRGFGRLPVLDDEGRVVGLVTRRDLIEAIKP